VRFFSCDINGLLASVDSQYVKTLFRQVNRIAAVSAAYFQDHPSILAKIFATKSGER
jgi:hypothetical protein